MYRKPRFLYFDLGQVILHFSHERMCQQIAHKVGITPEEARGFLFSSEVHLPYERGEMSTTELLGRLEQRFGVALPPNEALQALGDIFWLNTSMIPLLVGLKSAGHRLGILSNTCDAHWEVAHRQFSVLDQLFDVHLLSFRVGAVKPDESIFQIASEQADCAIESLFFVDDLLENVEGARAAGVDAVLYTGVPRLAEDLRKRQVDFRY